MNDQPYDIVLINTVKQFGVLFFNNSSGQKYNLKDVTIEIGHYCSNSFISILKDNMNQLGVGEYYYETLITSAAYPINQLFIVKFSGTEIGTNNEINKYETFRTVGQTFFPQENAINIITKPISKSLAKTNNRTNV